MGNTTGLIHLLVRTVAKGGNLEINFGPRPDGILPESMTVALLGTGRWLRTNGEAIYNTTGLPFGPDLAECSEDQEGGQVAKCFTRRGSTIYTIYLHWPTVASEDGAAREIRLEHV